MSYAPGLLGRVGVRRSAYPGPRLGLDIVDDVKRYGRVAFLVQDHIDLKKGKAFDAHLKAKHFGNGNQGFTGALPAGGRTGRQSFGGVFSTRTARMGIHNRINLPVNTYNQY